MVQNKNRLSESEILKVGDFMNIFLERVEYLRTDKKLSKSKILRDLGLNPNSFVNWEKRDNIPSGDILDKIAAYFGVSVDYLLGKDNPAATIPPDSRRESIAAMIEPLSDDQLRDLLEYVRFLHWKESQKCQ